MTAGADSSESPRVSRPRDEMCIAPGCGFVGAVITHISWRWLNLPYRHEFVTGAMLFILISASACVYGARRAHQWRVVLDLILIPGISPSVGHVAMQDGLCAST